MAPTPLASHSSPDGSVGGQLRRQRGEIGPQRHAAAHGAHPSLVAQIALGSRRRRRRRCGLPAVAECTAAACTGSPPSAPGSLPANLGQRPASHDGEVEVGVLGDRHVAALDRRLACCQLCEPPCLQYAQNAPDAPAARRQWAARPDNAPTCPSRRRPPPRREGRLQRRCGRYAGHGRHRSPRTSATPTMKPAFAGRLRVDEGEHGHEAVFVEVVVRHGFRRPAASE